jgi:nucleoid-associated protein YgaU
MAFWGLGVVSLLVLAGVAWRLALPYQQTVTTAPMEVAVQPAPPTKSPDQVPAPTPSTPAPGEETVAPRQAAAEPTPAPAEPAPEKPSFDIVRVTPEGSSVIAGRAAPNAEVTVLDSGQPIGHATADQAGQWVVLPDQKLPAGGQELTLSAKEPDKPEVLGNAPVVLVVPTRDAAKPEKPASPESPAPMAPLALLTPPNAAPRLLQGEPPAASKGHLALDVIDYDEHGAIRFAGSGEPGSTIQLYVDGADAGKANVDAGGHWGLLPSIFVANGQHRVRVDNIGIHGQVLARVELPFDRAVITPEEVMAGRVVVQPGQNLWRIARHAYGQGVHYTVIYSANRDQIRNANLIYPGQIFALPSLPAASPPMVSTGTSASASKSK